MRDARLVLIGQLVGQGSLVLITPILTRMVAPEEFGLFQIGTAIALIAQPIATLRTEFVIPATRGDRLARRRAILGNGVTLGLSVTLAMGGVVLILAGVGSSTVALSGALVLATYGWMAVENAVLVRAGQLRRLAVRNGLSGLFAAAAQVALVFEVPTAVALALGLFGGRALALLLTVRRGRDTLSNGNDAPYGGRRMLSAVTSGVVSGAAVHVPVIFSGAAFGASASGQVGLAQRIAGTPTTLIGQALGQVVTARVAPLIREDLAGLRRAVRQTLLRLLALSIGAAVLLAVAGPLLAEPVLGPGWGEAGWLLAIFALPLSLQFAILPVTPLFVMLHKEHSLLMLQIARLVLMILMATSVFIAGGGLIVACIAMSAAWTIVYVALIAFVLRYAGEHDAKDRPGEGAA